MIDPLSISLMLFGALAKSSAEGAAADHNARVALGNADMADMAADDAYLRGAREGSQLRRQATRLKASQASAYAASGVDVTAGTPADVLHSTDLLSEMDAETLEANAAREAWGFHVKAKQFRNQARGEHRGGEQAKQETFLTAGLNIAGRFPMPKLG